MAIKESKEYYTAAQTKNILGITDGMLYNYVDNGALERIIPPGKKQGVYRRSEVDQLARELNTFMVTRQKHPTIFSRATTREEILETTKISDLIFGGHIDIDRQMRWLRKNPEIIYVVKSESKVVGYVIILPLQPKKIEKLLLEEERTIDIEPNEIGLFKPGIPIHLYGGAIGILPGLTLAEKRTYGSRLVGGMINILIDMGKRGITIETFTARSTKPDGIRLLRNIGFTQMPSTTEKKDFILDVKRSGAREIMQYKRALIESGIPSETILQQYALSTVQALAGPENKSRQERTQKP